MPVDYISKQFRNVSSDCYPLPWPCLELMTLITGSWGGGGSICDQCGTKKTPPAFISYKRRLVVLDLGPLQKWHQKVSSVILDNSNGIVTQGILLQLIKYQKSLESSPVSVLYIPSTVWNWLHSIAHGVLDMWSQYDETNSTWFYITATAGHID